MNARHLTGPFQVVKDFEDALCIYTGAPYCVTTTSCTMALLLAVAYRLRWPNEGGEKYVDLQVEIPKRTYVGVPYAIREAGGRPTFRDEKWVGAYRLRPLPVWDSARLFTSGMYYEITGAERGAMVCVSFHWNKTLGVQQGGAILLDNDKDAAWLRRARFDGRAEDVPPEQDTFPLERAWHAYMAPETAAAGLVRLASVKRQNEPLPWDDYPDLSQIAAFR